MFEKLANFNQEALICVTRSKLLSAVFKDILKIKAKKFHDNCITEIDVNRQGRLTPVATDGIDLD